MEGDVQKDVGTAQLGLQFSVALLVLSLVSKVIATHPASLIKEGPREVERHTQGHTAGNVRTTVPTQGSLLPSARTPRGAVQLLVFDFLPVCLVWDFMILPPHSSLLSISSVTNKHN